MRIYLITFYIEIPYDEPIVSPGQLSESALLYKLNK